MSFRSRFRDMPIARKLQAVILGTSGFAVLASCAGFLAYQWFAARDDLRRSLTITAEIVGDQCTAALEFDQPRQAETILGSLKLDRQVAWAAIYGKDGSRFAHFHRDGESQASVPERIERDAAASRQAGVLLHVPIRSAGEVLGTIGLRSDMSEVRRRLWISSVMVALVLVGSGIGVYLLSRWLGGLVSQPIRRLAAAVESVSQTRDYAVRVEAAGRDELGHLMAGFNDMLSQIHRRDCELAAARDELELRVMDRTRELREEVAVRRAAENRLQENQYRLNEAQEIARLGSWEWNVAGGQVTWSQQACTIHGLVTAGAGGTLGELVNTAHPDDRRMLRELLEGAASRRGPFLLNYRIVLANGSIRYLQGRGKTFVDDDGRAARLVGTFQDVTERQLAEEAIHNLNRALEARMADLAAVNTELEAFSYSVSHDLRAPLRAIDGYSKMFLEDFAGTLNVEGRRYLNVICQNTLKMGQLIDDLLSFSKLGRKALQCSPVDLGKLAREVFTEIHDMTPERRMELRVAELPAVIGDPAMIRQVMVNLVSNAVKYTRGKDPAIIEIGTVEADGETACFVRDNGVGFDMAYVHKLFGVFQRLHTSEEFEGTGVGLALVQRIVKRHGGRVWAEGKLNEGASIYFTLPPPARATTRRNEAPASERMEAAMA